MIDLDYIKKIDNARVKLLECTSRDEVEEVFAEYGITDYPPKIALLRRCTQLQKTGETPGIAANDETAYEEYLDIFLTGELKKSGLITGSAIHDPEGDKKHPEKNKAVFNTEELCRNYNVSENQINYLENFYETVIIPRINKKYLAQLISVVEDIIEDAIEEKDRDQEKKLKIKLGNSITSRYRIKLIEGLTGFEWGTRTACTLCFPRFSFIYYNPTRDENEICSSVAHELGHLLQHYSIIKSSIIDKENYAKLFAFFATRQNGA